MRKYCDNPDCQRLRKRRTQKDFYYREKEKKDVTAKAKRPAEGTPES